MSNTTTTWHSIREASMISGLPESTLRYYEQIGIIDPIARDPSSGHRVYSDKDIESLTTIACLAATGMPLESMREYLKNRFDPQGIVEMRELILKLNREKQITVLISSHILDELSRLATHYGIIDNGRMVKELSAEELDTVCRKCVRMEVTDTSTLARVLDYMNLEYKIISATTADVFAKINVTQLTVVLAKENCEVLSMQEKDESLESYYISLVGGDNNA